jgi:hypothetical protein
MWWLKLLADGWRADSADRRPMAARCPLSTDWPFLPQVVTWLQWVEKHGLSPSRRTTRMGSGQAPLSMMLPGSASAVRPALTLLEGPPDPRDIQLLTTNADSFGGVEELARPADALELDGFEAFSQRVARELPVPTASLWSFAQFTT